MGCGSSKSAVLPVGDDLGPINISVQTPQGLAFEVPLHDDEDSLIKRHPPRRLQRLEEQRQVSPPNLQELQDRLAEAEQRRLQILSQRVASARAKQKLKRCDNMESRINGLMVERLHQEEPTTVEL